MMPLGKWLRLTLLAFPFLTAAAQDAGPVVARVDRRFELMSIVFRLADFKEYRMGSIADYNKAVDTHFAPYKNHHAIDMARELRQSVAYDAIPSLAVRVRDAADFAPMRPLGHSKLGLDPRWKPEVAADFLKAMAAFAKDADAEDFFRAQEPFYRRLIENCRSGLLSRLEPGWFEDTFGKRSRDTFTLCIAPLNGPGNYGPSCPNARGGNDLYAFLGTPPAGKGEIPAIGEGTLPLLVHEFLHSFVNPWVERNLKNLLPAGEALNTPVMMQMRQLAYGPAETALKESLVRAFTIRYFRDNHREAQAVAVEEENHRVGFYWVKDLARELEALGLLRKKARGLEALTPRLVAAFKRLGAEAPSRSAAWKEGHRLQVEALFAEGPKLVRMEPADHSPDVPPETAVLRFVFDRPMKPNRAVMHADGNFPEVDGQSSWDAEGKVLSLPVKLAPGTKYRLGLNAEDFLVFQDQEGRPLRPLVLGFTTR